MTLANKITIARLCLIPVFVVLAVEYGIHLHSPHPIPMLRYAAVLVFLIAAVSDGIDGFIARHYNQRSYLGSILDPAADKTLLVAGILVLTFSDWEYEFPIWFPILIITRDFLLAVGALFLKYKKGKVQIKPNWMGKIATVTQMIAILWVMLRIPFIPPVVFVYIAGFFTLTSGVAYLINGIEQLCFQRA